ncbi:hypothetical protein AB6A23_23960 [Paenibacillus tarimensis]
MNKLMIMIMLMGCMISGCMNNEKTITVLQIEDLFEKHGIPLAEPTELNTENVFLKTLNGVKPETFMINDDQLVSIYVYSSSNGVMKGIKDFEDKTATADVSAHSRYKVANVLIFYAAEGSYKDNRIELVVKDLKAL